MKLLLIILSTGFFFTGITYFYNPDLIIKINAWIKKVFFDEKKLLINRKKTGSIYVILAVIIFYLGVYVRYYKPQDTRSKVFQIWECYYSRQYDRAEKIAKEVLCTEPGNIIAMEQLGLVYFSKGEKEKSRFYLKKVLTSKPSNKRIKDIYEMLLKKR